MVTIKNTQRRIPIDKAWLASFTTRAIAAAGYAGWGVSVWITTDRTIRSYNARFRKKDKATDILSFPFYPYLTPGQRPEAVDEDGRYLGDLIISAERVHADAQDLGVSLDERLKVLIVHGICHVLGHDHETDAEYRAMCVCEKELLSMSDR